jgi:hypothetical protein
MPDRVKWHHSGCLHQIGVVFVLSMPLLAQELAPPARQDLPASAPHYSLVKPARLKHFTTRQIALLEKLNRADRRHLSRLPGLIVPDRWDLDELEYSPLPAFSSWAAESDKALVVDLAGQIFGAYESGHLVRWGPVSSGTKANPTPAGLFFLEWRALQRRSSINQDWLMRWYFNFQARRGLALHQHPLPGRPASHACIRLLERDAIWLYRWGEVGGQGRGTPVLVIGRYDFSSPRPWLEPEWWQMAVRIPEAPPQSYSAGTSSGD